MAEQKGIWPDGSSGAIKAHFCIGCRLVESDPQPIGKCSGADFEGVAVVPASLAEELAEALSPVAKLADRLRANGHLDPEPGLQADPDLTFPADVELSVADLRRAQAALTRYRQAIGGDDGLSKILSEEGKP